MATLHRSLVGHGWVVVLTCVGWARFGQSAEPVDYLKQVKPLLESRCYACHGTLKQNGKLRLDTVAFAIKGGSSGPAIVPGNPDRSELLARVSAQDPAERMPPEHEGAPLTADEIETLRRWIAGGAPHPADEQPEADPRQHWAFQPIRRPGIPAVKNSAWVRHPIDAFIAKKHEERGLTPWPEASREVLLRRLTIDLIGVPPTPEEIAAVLADPREDWYERAVNRLLEDPRYGERWARHWMDIWRYSDWWGLGNEHRNSQKHIWHWRDWIVESLNRDVPYDEMVRQMLAADELYPNDLDKLRATGYLARNFFLFNRHQWLDEVVEHVSKGFLGLTMNCVRCHDHKYDPFPQITYYQLRAFFEPYHARLDMVPGETNLERDGIPRVFDAWPDEPTYRFIRGDEKNPDQSRKIEPRTPEVLTPATPEIRPVDLPVEEWQPQRRPWVTQAYLAEARQKVQAAEKNLAAIQQTAARLRELADNRSPGGDSPSTSPNLPLGTPSLIEDFATIDAGRWERFGGEWKQHGDRIEQTLDAGQRSVLRLRQPAPRDFDATLRFTLLGGTQWRSIGIGFDVADGDPTKDTAADYHEQMVYVSAYAGGPKIHAAYNSAGQWHYPPPPAVRMLPIQLNREYTLRVQVRDRWINAYLNGVPVIACQAPLPRRDGHFQIFTFDATAMVHDFRLSPLHREIELLRPESPALQGEPVLHLDDALADLAVAEAAAEIARADLAAIQHRAEAWQAIWSQASEDQQRSAHTAAIRAIRASAVARANHNLAVAKRQAQRTSPDKRAEAEKAVQAAQDALNQAQAALNAEVKPDEKLEEFVGARWVPTRFRNSTADDPAPTFQPKSTGRRSALARWITDPNNPLPARVAVNHIWNRHFGTPLVPTVFDFGRKGQRPTHPELLDWLAREFIDSGWSMKHLHRQIVLSATYRMASSGGPTEPNRTIDPDNTLLWRRTPIRLESQVVRDSLLALAGWLDPKVGGPSIPSAEQADSKRRSLYFFHSNNERNLFLTMFDEALVTDCYRREQSIVPQQALAMTNSRLVLDVSGPIAERITKVLQTRQADSDEAFVREAFLVVLADTPTEAEFRDCLQSLAEWRRLPEAGEGPAAAQFARSQLVWVLLNHNDFITVR